MVGSGCGSVGIAQGGPQFEFGLWQTFIQNIWLLSTVTKKRNKTKKSPLKKNDTFSNLYCL